MPMESGWWLIPTFVTISAFILAFVYGHDESDPTSSVFTLIGDLLAALVSIVAWIAYFSHL